jgi:predicted dehydrogenase
VLCADSTFLPATPRSPVRLGVVGCGAIVREGHLPALKAEPGAEVRILCDKDRRNCALAKKQFALSATETDRLDTFAGKVEAAIVAVPPRFHAPVAIQLLEMGIDVLCEKPLATTAAEAERMIQAAERHERILAVGLMTRFYKHNQVLQTVVRSGMLGVIKEVVAEQGAPLDWTMTTASYYNRETTSGGVFFDAGVHLIDRVLWLFGDLDEVEYEDDSYGGVESNAVLHGSLWINGKRVACHLGFSWTHKLNNSIKVIGTEATAEARFEEPDTVLMRRDIGGVPMKVSVQMDQPGSETLPRNPFSVQVKDFISAVRQRREPHVPASSAVGALRIIERAYAVRKPIAQPWVEATGRA